MKARKNNTRNNTKQTGGSRPHTKPSKWSFLPRLIDLGFKCSSILSILIRIIESIR